MGYTDKAQQREYQRNWVARKREAWIVEQGSKCANCKTEEGPWEVDHLDPSTKVSHRVWSWSAVRRAEELKKCQLLCASCHWEKTAEENSGLTIVHGTATSYRYGCRCNLCREAKKLENASRY